MCAVRAIRVLMNAPMEISPRRHQIVAAPVANGNVGEAADGDGSVDLRCIPLGAADARFLDKDARLFADMLLVPFGGDLL